MGKHVYFFGGGGAEGSSQLRTLLGGKGCELAEMTNLGILVPPGFTVTTEAWSAYVAAGRRGPDGLGEEVQQHLARLEQLLAARLGDPVAPLLVSVRSGARVSMPGMMETVLNLGLNDRTVEGLARRTANERFAWDCYRRFLTMYGDVVCGIDRRRFEGLLDAARSRAGVATDADLPAPTLRELVAASKGLYEEAGEPFPQEPAVQLERAIRAVFDSWFSKKAEDYRRIHGIPNNWGTAVTVQAMVFGNLGETSGTGVAFTRDPSTGERRFFGEFLPNAQGEDVVAGIRTPQPVATLQGRMPAVYQELEATYQTLERHYRDMLDIEFTVQDGVLYLLQTRPGKRTAAAAVRIAVDMVGEGLIDRETAVLRVDPAQVDRLLHPVFDAAAKRGAVEAGRLVARGLPAAPGAAVGCAVFTPEDAEEWAARGERVILVRAETAPEDVAGMHAAEGILTARGGLTSHAAVVGRGMGKTCVVGCGEILVDEEALEFRRGDLTVRQGEVISLDGETGEVLLGEIPTRPSEVVQVLVEKSLTRDASPIFQQFDAVMQWADALRTMAVRANADTPSDAATALAFGAEGIGLCRTEHMFFKPEDRIPIVREMILAKDRVARLRALGKLLPMQREDFVGIFRTMGGRPVTIRLLDPPLHEFLPNEREIGKELGAERARRRRNRKRIVELEGMLAALRGLQEANPMLGHRGCRLGITYPEIYEMQVRAIFEATVILHREGVPVEPEVMIPLTGTVGEMQVTRELAVRAAEAVLEEAGIRIPYSVGTMIEVPRAALVADQIARHADFFSFGTNDLTQLTYGYSRDDVSKFLPLYLERELVARDPFRVLDPEGVGELVRIGIERGRGSRPDLKVGICGEHGGEPSSVEFCHRAGMTYVSCSPFMIPTARLAAAQARVRQGGKSGDTRAA
ncbi:MAG: pyruvate, phosphate dikinase [Candidatus Rokuibacteriota bacterium]|nr:MAG: pyruvate, phosphate dikinase [Candidatus Rokubacteria bacterium]